MITRSRIYTIGVLFHRKIADNHAADLAELSAFALPTYFGKGKFSARTDIQIS